MSQQSNVERQEQIEKLIKNYKYYQDKLLQVTQKNRSVLLKKIYNKHNFDLTQLEKIKEGTIGKIVSKTIKNIGATLNDKKDDGESQNILLDSIENDDADSARAKLRTLSRNLMQIEEETGQQTGYFGFPFLQGHPNPEFYIRGPLILFPISLEYKRQAKNGGWFLHFSDKRPILNGALIAALKKKGGYQLPENYEETFDDLIEDLSNGKDENLEQYFFKKVNDWIKTIIPIDETKNQTQTVPLDPLSREDLEKLEKQPFHLVNYKIIGNFPQADNEIYKDYNELIKNADLLDVGVIGELIDVEDPDRETFDSGDPQIDIDNTKDIELNTILPSDSSQDEVILESKNSDLVVVRGPPGTGKSQVIVNLISDALTNSKKVLVACQKRAALEVVKQRLGQVGLDRYVVFLEKELDDRLKMYAQLYGIIEEEPEPTSYSELTVEEISAKIDGCVHYLAELGKALRKEYFGGATAQRIYTRADGQYNPVLDLSSAELDLAWNGLESYIQKIQDAEAAFKRFEDKSHPWFGRTDFAEFGLMEKSRLHQLLQELIDLTPTCTLASNSEDQSKLESLFDTYLNNPGLLKIMKRKSAEKGIEQILRVKVTENFVSENLDRVKNGIKFWNLFSELLAVFDYKKRAELEAIVTDARSLVSYLTEMQNSLGEFDAMQELDKKKREYEKSIFAILRQAKNRFSIDDNWSEKIRQEIYAYWLAKIEQENPILKGDPISNYQRERTELAKLMEEKRKIVTKTIQRKIEGVIHPKYMYGRNRTEEQKEWRAFSAELKKKRKVKPVRKLFQDYSYYLFQIAPCWLASPEAVSKVFPLQRDLFDLVIVDEASQLAVERAIPFLYRARRVVIAGDEKQLPPFDLFQLREEESEDEDEEISDEKSLLELARARYRTINLSWHYRSQYQDLINFSNHAFYEGLLNVAPNATNDPQHPPIRWIKCNGMWDNQTNAIEAKRVVDEIQNIWQSKFEQEGKYPSIGVITFNEKQQDRIKDFIDTRKETDPTFLELYTAAHEGAKKDDTLFVKNIENVQGDERDVIIFSVGYAKDADGKFANFFGTLSMKGGENRLNVAVTRARKEMIVVSSIEPADIKPTSKYDGPKRLRQFLDYAKMTSLLNEEGQRAVLSEINPDMERVGGTKKAEFDSEFEIQVYKKLQERGHKVETQVGFSGYRIDLAVIHPHDENRYVLGIECDGATFHSAKSVRERDVMRQKFLEGKDWKIERIWSRNWWRNPKREIDRIDARINELVKGEVIQR
jgi:very-short-patch-repair endonuclease